MTREEAIDILDDTQRQLTQLRDELVKAKEELDWTRAKLKEAQERNRKLDWVLTRTIEAL